ncbi:MAG: cytochrome c maturation protein CcmE [Gemmatimonadales bacterium]|nr:cytochrome c maturation protein CcmE [Gemmatimonadales bacterium]
MKAGTKFTLGAAIIVGATALLIYTGISQTGVYFLSPSELLARVEADASFHEVGLKVGAKVVPGSIRRDDASRRIEFQVSDASGAFPVVYEGLVPDTFTDENDIEVIMSGKLGRDGVFHATEVLAKCGSRYESEYSKLAQAS